MFHNTLLDSLLRALLKSAYHECCSSEWLLQHSSSSNKDEDELVDAPSYPNWLTFFRNPTILQELPKVIIYINIRLSFLHFSLCKDIFNHKNISLISFFNCESIYFLLNIYSDSFQIALKYSKNTEAYIDNVLIITGYFNIRDSS